MIVTRLTVWTSKTIIRYFFTLAASGRFPLEGLTSHVFAPDQCAEAYATANRDRAPQPWG